MLQQTFFFLLNVSFPPCSLSPLLLLSLFLSLFFRGGARAGSAPAWIRAWFLIVAIIVIYEESFLTVATQPSVFNNDITY